LGNSDAVGNVLTKGKKKKGDEAVREGRLEEARVLFQSVTKTDPADAEGWVKLGEINRRLGRFAEAETCCRRGLKLQPRLGFAHFCLGGALQCQGKVADAVACYRESIRYQPDLADAHYFLGNALLELGEVSEAESAIRKALDLRPSIFAAWSDLGSALITLGRYDEARAALERAQALGPGSPEVLANLATVFESEGRATEALEYYRLALNVNSGALDVWAKRAELLERLHRIDEADHDIEEGLSKGPDHPRLLLIASRVDRRLKRHARAIDRLIALGKRELPSDIAAEANLLLGQLYDAEGQSELALPRILEGKRLIASATDPHGHGRDRFLERVEQARNSVKTLVRGDIETSSNDDAPIFLVGFPRSGTTLLEQIVDSHPRLQTLDERPVVAEMERAFREMTGNEVDGLNRLTADQIATLRKIYFATAANYVDRQPDTRLVDKLPLNIVSVPLIWRVFPHAQFLLAMRHPCDVSLSCLMQSFGQNDAMAGFVSLESIATIYVQVMSAWEEFDATLPIEKHIVRYEDLIVDVEASSRRLFDFLRVGWDDAVLGHTEHARTRVIKTPSYHQVSQPIYQTAKYRWRRYENAFAPVLPQLSPFIQRYGYD
jgi:tetratricopeptide (TPR) repeat protein